MKNGFFPLVVAGALLSNGAAAQEDAPKFYVGSGFGLLTVPKDDDVKFSNAKNGSIQFGYKISENFAIEAQYSKSVKAASAKAIIEDIDVSNAWWQSTLALNLGATINDVRQWFPFITAEVAADLEAKVETTALYGVYRSGGDLYFKAKAGYVSAKTKVTATTQSADIHVTNDVNQTFDVTLKRGDELFNTFSLNQTQNISDTQSDFSAGLGVGYKFNKSLFSELEYTKLTDDYDFLSLSINYSF